MNRTSGSGVDFLLSGGVVIPSFLGLDKFKAVFVVSVSLRTVKY